MTERAGIVIVGAGLTGTALAIYLARSGRQVTILDKRADPRFSKTLEGRSINLAISHRGRRTLDELGLLTDAKRYMSPMLGRAVHPLDDKENFQSYSRHPGHIQYSLTRSDLNQLLTREALEHANIQFLFQHTATDIDLDKCLLTVHDKQQDEHYQLPFKHAIAADGGYSRLRQRLAELNLLTMQVDTLSHGYKELNLSATQARGLRKDALHIWPRQRFMGIALPNYDGSFTATLFMSKQMHDEHSFAHLNSDVDINHFFERYFPEWKRRLPDLLQQYHQHPCSDLHNARCTPWSFDDKLILVGDAAHAVVPFLGQGMNAAFEDCRLLMQSLAQYNDWGVACKHYCQTRERDLQALSEMALANYHEMRDAVIADNYLRKRALMDRLVQYYPKAFISQYEWVSFSSEPYHFAQAVGRLQESLLSQLIELDEDSLIDKDHSLIRTYLKAYQDLLPASSSVALA